MGVDEQRLARQVRLGLAAAAIVVLDLAVAAMGRFGPLFFVAIGIAGFQLYLGLRRSELAKPLRYANIAGAVWVFGYLGYVLIGYWTGS